MHNKALAAIIALFAASPAQAWTFSQLYAFKGAPDAAQPRSGLTLLNGIFYGTSGGGASSAGAIYAITPAGAETVIYSFTDTPNFVGDLAVLNGVLYGATYLQGADDAGSLYSVTPAGAETTLVSFGGHRDRSGAYPEAGLTPHGNTLYGTTLGGGTDRIGVTFTLGAAGNYRALSSFTSVANGYYPAAPLLYENGMFYGTTEYGGSGPCTLYYGGCGTIFSMTRSGAVTTLASFPGGADAAYPTSGLIYQNGVFYGTTQHGGAYNYGTVYSYTPGVGEKILYSFPGGRDGASPAASLTAAGSAFYGTTLMGGTGCKHLGCGTVFEITPAGAEKIIHRFNGTTDGASPLGRLTNLMGTLYGTTSGIYATAPAVSSGTIFALSR